MQNTEKFSFNVGILMDAIDFITYRIFFFVLVCVNMVHVCIAYLLCQPIAICSLA